MKNPTIEIITGLTLLKGESIFVKSLLLAIKDGRYADTVSEIYAQSKDNRPLVAKLVGENLLTKIERLCGI